MKLVLEFGMFESPWFILTECSLFPSPSADKVVTAQCESDLATLTFCILLSLLSLCQCFWIVNFGRAAFALQ